MEGKNLIVTGATGFLGSRTVEYLIQQQDIRQILATGRKFAEAKPIEHHKVKYELGDLTNKEFAKGLFDNQTTHLVHCAAFSSPWGKYKDFYRANVMAVQYLCDLCKINEVPMVHISSPSVYFNFKDRWDLREDAQIPKKFANAYAETKRLAELELEQSEITFISLRPRALIGRGDRVILPRMINAVKKNRLRIIGNGDNIVDLTSVENVARAIYLAINARENAWNHHYNITNDQPVNLWDIIRYTLKQLELSFPEKKISLSQGMGIAKIMEFMAKNITKREPTLTKHTVGALGLNFTMNIQKAKDLLGYQAVKRTKESIDEFVLWYKDSYGK